MQVKVEEEKLSPLLLKHKRGSQIRDRPPKAIKSIQLSSEKPNHVEHKSFACSTTKIGPVQYNRVSLTDYSKNFFIIEPQECEVAHHDLNQEYAKARGREIDATSPNVRRPSKRLPLYLSNKRGNRRDPPGSLESQDPKSGFSSCEVKFLKSSSKRNDTYEHVVTTMHDYFHSMKKFISKPHSQQNSLKKQVSTGKEIRCQQHEHLNVKGLRPNISKREEQVKTEEFAEDTQEMGSFLDNHNHNMIVKPKMSKTRASSQNNTRYGLSHYRNTYQCLDNRSPEKAKQNTVSGNNNQPNGNSGNNQSQSYFMGMVRVNSNAEQIQKLKIVYYKDFIWKVWFNQGFKPKADSQERFKFYVGKGNNSRLIRNIMGKRWWWAYEPKEDNAQFLWTQLKVSSVYRAQPSLLEETPKSERLIGTKEDNSHQVKQEGEKQPKDKKGRWLSQRLKISDKSASILGADKYDQWRQYITQNKALEKRAASEIDYRWALEKEIEPKQRKQGKVTNHLELSRMIGNKKALYSVMKAYYERKKPKQQCIPQSFHITAGLEDDEYLRFLNEYYRKNKEGKSTWIVKPGEITNRGVGIKFCRNLFEIKPLIKSKESHSTGCRKTFLIQEYIDSPLLYQGRKFDLRHYIMITSVEGKIRGYYYSEGYARTTSYKYQISNRSSYVHLTNDAVQKSCKEYGKYERGNKLSYPELDRYMKANNLGDFYADIAPQIRRICIDVIEAAFKYVDPKRRINNFEIYGLDILVDSDLKCWLIECNTNPCIELSSPVMARLIPGMLDNAFSIAVDPLFPPPDIVALCSKKTSLPDNYLVHNKFQLVFDEAIDQESHSQVSITLQKELSGINYEEDEAFESHEDEYDAAY